MANRHLNVNGLLAREQLYCDAYLADPEMIGSRAAIKAGYSAATADVTSARLLRRDRVRAYIDSRLKAIHDAQIADADEVMRYLTQVVRDETTEEAVVVEGGGEGVSEARKVDKRVPARDRVKAAELLAKRYGLLTDKIQAEITGTIVIDGDADLQPETQDDA